MSAECRARQESACENRRRLGSSRRGRERDFSSSGVGRERKKRRREGWQDQDWRRAVPLAISDDGRKVGSPHGEKKGLGFRINLDLPVESFFYLWHPSVHYFVPLCLSILSGSVYLSFHRHLALSVYLHLPLSIYLARSLSFSLCLYFSLYVSLHVSCSFVTQTPTC